jgi:Phage integrase, N-terminal SAM-like domain
MALRKRGGIWYFRKMINGRLFRESTGFADRKAAERRANEIELDIRAGVHGWKSTIPSFAEWWDVYRKTYTPLKSARNRDVQIVAHFLPHFGARRLDEITKSDIVRYLNLRRTQMTGNPGHKNRRLVSESTCGASGACSNPSSSVQSTRATTFATRSAASSAARTSRGRAS